MKIIKHEKLPQHTETFIVTRPFSIWLNRKKELQIEPGDTLEEISDVLYDTWELDRKVTRRIAAYFFALGARVEATAVSDVWRADELDVSPDRRYLG